MEKVLVTGASGYIGLHVIAQLIDRRTKGLVPMLDKHVLMDNSQTINILKWEPMPLDQAFIEHAKSITEIRESK